MPKFNTFTTFAEAKESQEYDYLFQRSFGLATTSGVDVAIVRELNLHILNEAGQLPLDQYIADNNLIVEYPAIYEYAKKHWTITTAWSAIYKYGDNYIYCKDHSDRTYPIIELEYDSLFTPIDENGNVIIPFTEENLSDSEIIN